MFRNEVDFSFASEFTGVFEEDYIIIFDAQDKPLIIFPRAGRDVLFLKDYVSMCMRFFDVNAHTCADSSKNSFSAQYKTITGLDHLLKLENHSSEIVTFLDSHKVNKRKKSLTVDLSGINQVKVS